MLKDYELIERAKQERLDKKVTEHHMRICARLTGETKKKFYNQVKKEGHIESKLLVDMVKFYYANNVSAHKY